MCHKLNACTKQNIQSYRCQCMPVALVSCSFLFWDFLGQYHEATDYSLNFVLHESIMSTRFVWQWPGHATHPWNQPSCAFLWSCCDGSCCDGCCCGALSFCVLCLRSTRPQCGLCQRRAPRPHMVSDCKWPFLPSIAYWQSESAHLWLIQQTKWPSISSCSYYLASACCPKKHDSSASSQNIGIPSSRYFLSMLHSTIRNRIL